MCKLKEQWFFGSSSSKSSESDTGMGGFTGGPIGFTSGDRNPVSDYDELVTNYLTAKGASQSETDMHVNAANNYEKEPNMYYIYDVFELKSDPDKFATLLSENPSFGRNEHETPSNCLLACNMSPKCNAVVLRRLNYNNNDYTRCWFKKKLTHTARQASPSDQVGTFIKKTNLG